MPALTRLTVIGSKVATVTETEDINALDAVYADLLRLNGDSVHDELHKKWETFKVTLHGFKGFSDCWYIALLYLYHINLFKWVGERYSSSVSYEFIKNNVCDKYIQLNPFTKEQLLAFFTDLSWISSEHSVSSMINLLDKKYDQVLNRQG